MRQRDGLPRDDGDQLRDEPGRPFQQHARRMDRQAEARGLQAGDGGMEGRKRLRPEPQPLASV